MLFTLLQAPFEIARNNAMRKLLVQLRTIRVQQIIDDKSDTVADDKR